MKRPLLLLTLLVATFVVYARFNEQTFRANSLREDSEPAQQKPKYDPKNPAGWPDSLDAVMAAPKNHKVVLENDRVRVLDVTVQPGERESLHAHRWPSVLYIMAEDNIRDYDADGKLLYDSRTEKSPPKTPYTIWMEPQPPHAVENFSRKPLRLLRVELKQ